MQRRGFTTPVTVFTKANTADNERRFFPISSAYEAAKVAAVLALFEIYALTGDTLFQVGFQESDNLDLWPDAATFARIGTTSATAGPEYSNGAYEGPAQPFTKAFVRFGIIVRNNNGNPARIELSWVSGRFMVREC